MTVHIKKRDGRVDVCNWVNFCVVQVAVCNSKSIIPALFSCPGALVSVKFVNRSLSLLLRLLK